MHSLIETVTADVQSSEGLRLLAVFPAIRADGWRGSSAMDSHGVEEVVYAYAYERIGEKPRYFKTSARVQAPAGWPRSEFKTARQAIEACLYANGFGGKEPAPIARD